MSDFSFLDEGDQDRRPRSVSPVRKRQQSLNPLLIAALLVFCFPVGLYFVWTHRQWSGPTKCIWTGVWAGVILFGLVASRMAEQRVTQMLADADALWNSGKKADAVDKYRSLLDERRLPKSDRPALFRRVIEFDADQNNLAEAKTLILKARGDGVSLSLESPKAKSLLAQIEAEEEAKRKAAEQAKLERAKQNAAKQKQKKEQEREELAFYMAIQFVKKELRNPSTAEFCDISEAAVVPLGNNRYMVGGYVNSQNGFGGMSRALWAVTVEDQGEQWRKVERITWK
jgi:hypothetical protein